MLDNDPTTDPQKPKSPRDASHPDFARRLGVVMSKLIASSIPTTTRTVRRAYRVQIDPDPHTCAERLSALQLEFYLRHGLTRRQPERRWFHRIEVCCHGHPCADCCWEWTGSKNEHGYGRSAVNINATRKETYVHRAVWSLIHQKSVPSGMEICHTCDHRACCNPAHLWLGTHQENIQDRVAKGRGGDIPRGEASASAKLTEAGVEEIWSLSKSGMNQRDIARHFAISQVSVHYVLTRQTWRHVTDRLFNV